MKTLKERFDLQVDKSADCWEWVGSKIPQGYGHIHHNHADIYAHRASWIIYYGEIPNGLCVLHRCDNPSCVNPEHLFIGTIADNMHDRDAKGRNNKGKRYPYIARHKHLKEFCKHGHELTPDNLYFRNTKHGIQRTCKNCFKRRAKEYYKKKKEKKQK
jgi:hypothetical protein